VTLRHLPEIAWNEAGAWTGRRTPCPGSKPAAVVPCACSRESRTYAYRHGVPLVYADCGVFMCVWCRRFVPYCYGGSGVHPLEDSLCNACWCEAAGDQDDYWHRHAEAFWKRAAVAFEHRELLPEVAP